MTRLPRIEQRQEKASARWSNNRKRRLFFWVVGWNRAYHAECVRQVGEVSRLRDALGVFRVYGPEVEA